MILKNTKLNKLLTVSLIVCMLLVGFTEVENRSHAQHKPKPGKSKGGLNLSLLGTYKTGIFDEGAAEISAYDPGSSRLFVTNANDGTIDVLSIINPESPEKLFSINVADFVTDGEVNSVAASGGILAAAVHSPGGLGKAVFFDTDVVEPVQPMKIVEVGSLPDMITFTPDGYKVLVANEGEPADDGSVDPEGSISIIDLPSFLVTQVDFKAFNGKENELRNKGVRIFKGNLAANDLEPEFISVSPDGTTAFITLQENNAFAVLDINSATIKDIVPLGYKDYSKGQPRLETIAFDEPPLDKERNILFGGLSGLFFEGLNKKGNPTFVTVPDRGPNGDPTPVTFINNPNKSETVRPFLIPDYQAQVIRFEWDKKHIRILERINLTRNDGVTPITGLPNIPGIDETPATPVDDGGDVVDNSGNQFKLLPYDEFGADLEGIVIDPKDHSYWMVDEYRPAIYHFQPDGRLLQRFVPQGTAALAGLALPAGTFGEETLPAEYANRRANRGFEAMALDTKKGILYAFIQTPLANPDRATSDNSKVIRILGVNPANGEPVAEYVYLLEKPAFRDANVDKMGDAVYNPANGKFLVIERDSRAARINKKAIFEIDLKGATNTLGMTLPVTLESMTPDELVAMGINPVHKMKVVNLPSIGYLPSDKPEGLALLRGNDLAVINDNDFGLEGPELATTALGIIEFQTKINNNALDPSDKDGGINIRNWPVFGMYQPDAIASYEIDGNTYYITANEGDARDYDFFSEEERIKDDSYVLDAAVFPKAEKMKFDGYLGRLNITLENGDLDNDGDYDQIYTYGGRSFSIWDEFGNLVFDSADEIEQIIARFLPENFNANNDDNDIDKRSDNKGPEPEGVAYARINGKHYAFIGLERVGGILVYDVGRPNHPRFITYVNNRDFEADVESEAAGDLGPEGLLFIPADESPIGMPLLVVTNEVSGSTSIYRIDDGSQIQNTQFLAQGKDHQLKIFPNPVANRLTVTLVPGSKPKTVKIKNLINETLYTQMLKGAEASLEIDMAHLAQGQYVLELNDGSSIVKHRILKK